jgi:hypothetical protein
MNPYLSQTLTVDALALRDSTATRLRATTIDGLHSQREVTDDLLKPDDRQVTGLLDRLLIRKLVSYRARGSVRRSRTQGRVLMRLA